MNAIPREVSPGKFENSVKNFLPAVKRFPLQVLGGWPKRNFAFPSCIAKVTITFNRGSDETIDPIDPRKWAGGATNTPARGIHPQEE